MGNRWRIYIKCDDDYKYYTVSACMCQDYLLSNICSDGWFNGTVSLPSWFVLTSILLNNKEFFITTFWVHMINGNNNGLRLFSCHENKLTRLNIPCTCIHFQNTFVTWHYSFLCDLCFSRCSVNLKKSCELCTIVSYGSVKIISRQPTRKQMSYDDTKYGVGLVS